MTTESIPITVRILDKEFRVACPENEQNSLIASADLLNTRMREVRDSGKVFGTDRVAIMAALNLTHELLLQRHNVTDTGDSFTQRIENMQSNIEGALQSSQQQNVEF
jgi:cell division protein ZapA